LEDDVATELPERITPKVLRTPRAAGLAGVLFAVLFGVIVVLLRKVVPSNPHQAGDWLTRAGDRRELRRALTLVPFCGIFFLWFMGAVRSRIGDLEDRFLATVFLGSGLLFVAMLFVSAAVFDASASTSSSCRTAQQPHLWRSHEHHGHEHESARSAV
jgi:hypothetical protein